MKRYVFFLLFLIELMACKSKSMTLEDLKKASWSKLDTGVEYISLKNDKTELTDSIHFIVKGFLRSNIIILGDGSNEIEPTLDSIITPILNNKLSKSKHGYLKINLYEIASPEFLTATVFLLDTDDSLQLNKDIKTIREIKGVVEVNYISKEMAKKRYLDDGNENWDYVLDSNPLPASIEIKFDKKTITPEEYDDIRNKIKDEMPYTSSIQFSSDLFKKLEGLYYILEYSR